MAAFSDIWDDVKDFLSRNRVVRVCGVGDFTVVDFSDVGIFVMSKDSSEPELVRREWVEAVWSLLLEKKTVCPDDLIGCGVAGLWSSFILSLLSYQPAVGYVWDGRSNCFFLNEK